MPRKKMNPRAASVLNLIDGTWTPYQEIKRRAAAIGINGLSLGQLLNSLERSLHIESNWIDRKPGEFGEYRRISQVRIEG